MHLPFPKKLDFLLLSMLALALCLFVYQKKRLSRVERNESQLVAHALSAEALPRVDGNTLSSESTDATHSIDSETVASALRIEDESDRAKALQKIAAEVIRVKGFETFVEAAEYSNLNPVELGQFIAVAASIDLTNRDLVARTNVARRMDWLDRTTDDPDLIARPFMGWVAHDYNAAAAWLAERRPAAKYDQAAMWLIDSTASIDPDAARQWITFLFDDDLRSQISEPFPASKGEESPSPVDVGLSVTVE